MFIFSNAVMHHLGFPGDIFGDYGMAGIWSIRHANGY